MESTRLKALIKHLPADSFSAVRDISLLSASVLGECHAVTIKNMFGISMFTFWHILDTQVCFYRSKKENMRFTKTVVLRYWNNEKYAGKLSAQLMEETDWLRGFIEKNRTSVDFTKNARTFFAHYLQFFALHQAVNWGGEYLSSTKTDPRDWLKTQRIIEKLHAAYKYNEFVIPNLEVYFKKLKIKELLYDEIIAEKRNVSKKRSILFLEGRRFILSSSEAAELGEILESAHRVSGEVEEVRGLPVGGGTHIGRVKLVTNLENLKDIGVGDVLVTFMTRPQFNNQIIKAGAIVTNEGGILCHAAILAREFRIPCIVGTQIATKVLKDGNLVEVNADTGRVKILQRS